MKLFGRLATGFAMLAGVTAVEPVLAQSVISDGNAKKAAPCADLTNENGLKQCQKAFVASAHALYEAQKDLLNNARVIQVGSIDSPIFVISKVIQDKAMINMADQTLSAVAGACRDIGLKKSGQTERLDEKGDSIDLLRIAIRAKECAAVVEDVTQKLHVPTIYPLIARLDDNAEKAISRVNRIADRPDGTKWADASPVLP